MKLKSNKVSLSRNEVMNQEHMVVNLIKTHLADNCAGYTVM